MISGQEVGKKACSENLNFGKSGMARLDYATFSAVLIQVVCNTIAGEQPFVDYGKMRV